ncbi:MAG: hypothetical protein J6Y00_00045 [Paludibacteraceae bacterium]|nr:hypothetical protein [Paludibacteraceae bacterium]
MGDLVRFLIEFLLYGNKDAAQLVGYTEEESKWQQYKVVIVPCGQLGKRLVMPDMAEPRPERLGDTWVIRTDLVYNSFFFISGAEEVLVSEHDEHNRFLARHSLLGRDSRLMTPLIDEYGRMLLRLLGLPMPEEGLKAVYLTHDVDSIARYRHPKGFLGAVKRGHLQRALAAVRDIKQDPDYTFPWLMKQDAMLTGTPFPVYPLYFIKDTMGYGFDYPQYNLDGHDFHFLAFKIMKTGGQIGWHSSYYNVFYKKPNIAINYSHHRSHYLRCSLDWREKISHQGVMHDYSMGFPDQAGFRLQTSRPVQWINPYTYEVTTMVLHPLLLMDVTLSEERYMGLNKEDALTVSRQIIDKTRQMGGELGLLWHNSNLGEDTFHRELYPALLQYIQTIA